jgi:hypothetical protein
MFITYKKTYKGKKGKRGCDVAFLWTAISLPAHVLKRPFMISEGDFMTENEQRAFPAAACSVYSICYLLFPKSCSTALIFATDTFGSLR